MHALAHPFGRMDQFGGYQEQRSRGRVQMDIIQPLLRIAPPGRTVVVDIVAGNRERPLLDIVVRMRAERGFATRSEEHTSELQSLMRISYAVFCLKKTH